MIFWRRLAFPEAMNGNAFSRIPWESLLSMTARQRRSREDWRLFHPPPRFGKGTLALRRGAVREKNYCIKRRAKTFRRDCKSGFPDLKKKKSILVGRLVLQQSKNENKQNSNTYPKYLTLSQGQFEMRHDKMISALRTLLFAGILSAKLMDLQALLFCI